MEKRGLGILRELSWLQFNERVLLEASDSKNPIISRVHFLGIFSSNLDEFFKVRIASLKRELKVLKKKKSARQTEIRKSLELIHDRVIELQWEFDRVFDSTQKTLAKMGVVFKNEKQLSKEQQAFVRTWFEDEIRHEVIPLLISSQQPMPPLKDNALYLVVDMEMQKSEKNTYALIEVPDSVSRWVILPTQNEEKHVMFLEDVIRFNLKNIFASFPVKNAKAFDIKVVRDAEYEVENDFSKSVYDKISKSILQRSKGEYVRLNFDHQISEELLQLLLSKLKIKEIENIIPGGRYHNKRDLISFPNFGHLDWQFPKLETLNHPVFTKSKNILDAVTKQDVMLHFPYQKFSHLLDLLRAAAIDPSVGTIRISMYRIAKDSHILHALINAAKNGKRVIAIVEVQARFDEQHNLEITKMLQEAGVKVIPGIPGLKVHCKVFQISRKINGRTTRIIHIGTGNFHEKTARLYSDTTLITSHLEIGREVRKLFDFFESNFLRPQFRHLAVSPFNTRRKLVDAIAGEVQEAKEGREGRVVIKVNNLVDEVLIKKLLDAAEAGVKVSLIVRGVCLLEPVTSKQKANIDMRSILGRYLEHSRLFTFGVGDRMQIYLGSADLMMRNLDFRVEVLVPIYDVKLKQEIWEWLSIQLSNEVRARNLSPERINQMWMPKLNVETVDSQVAFRDYLSKKYLKA